MAEQKKPQTFVPSPEFLARKKRIEDAINLKRPDRVPVVPLNYTYFPTRVRGVSNREAMNDLENTFRIWKESVLDYDWDAAPPSSVFPSADLLKIMGIKQIKWPGDGLSDNRPFQWVEGEYMKQKEYDEVLADPAGFTAKKLWPRISDFFEPFDSLTNMPAALLLMLSNGYVLPDLFGKMFSSPFMADILKRAQQLAEVYPWVKKAHEQYLSEITNLGYPVIMGGTTITAFDTVSDMLRGMKGSMLDMYKVPDKLLALIDMFVPFTIMSALAGVYAQDEQLEIKGVFIPLHRGAGGFMSDKQFAKFYWPGLKALLLGIIEAGLTPMPYFEGDCTSRLKYLQELPAKKILPHWDIVDRKKAKEMLGDSMCFFGNVPASLMCTGTPQQVKEDVKELIDIFGDNGGLIISSVPGIPDEAKPENVRALVEAVHEYGTF